MSLLAHPIHRFLLKVLFWLPVCFFLWYWLSDYWLVPIHWAMDSLFVKFLPSVISEVERQGHLLEVVTRLNAPQGYAAGGILTFEIWPLAYAYSLPLYAALTLAAPAANRARKALYLGLGLVALMPFIALGTGFDILKHLAFTLSAETAPYIDFNGGRKELIGWGHQFGYLILPGVVPLAIWIALHRQFLLELAPNLATREAVAD